MTTFEYAEKVNDEDAREMYRIMVKAGLVDDPLDYEVLNEMKLALGYSRETDERSKVHSRSEDFIYQKRFSAEDLSREMYGNMLLAAVVLRHIYNWPEMAIHEWSDDTSFVIALTTKFEGDEYEKTLAVISFCNEGGDHFEIFDEGIWDTWSSEFLMKSVKDLIGFPSYEAHGLRKYLTLCWYTPYIDENGYCVPETYDKPSVPGNILYSADSTGMSILEATYSPYSMV